MAKVGQAQVDHFWLKWDRHKVTIMFETWEELEKSSINCNKCKLYKTRQNIVFGVGNREAEIMFIGEGPGADEDRMRRTICRKSREINGYGFSNSWYQKGRSIYCQCCKM